MNAHKPELRDPPVHVVLIDGRGIITDVQTQGAAPGRSGSALGQYGLALYEIGQSYLDLCTDDTHRADIQALLRRKRSLVSFVFPSRSQRAKRWFVAVGVPVGAETGSGAVIMHIDITAWTPPQSESEGGRQWSAPEALDPVMIQDTVSKALVRQFGPSPAARRPDRPHSGVESLSPRQHEVLMLVAAGKSNLEIAEELSCSLNTVKRHVTAVLQKLHLPNRTRAAMLANELNLEGRRFK